MKSLNVWRSHPGQLEWIELGDEVYRTAKNERGEYFTIHSGGDNHGAWYDHVKWIVVDGKEIGIDIAQRVGMNRELVEGLLAGTAVEFDVDRAFANLERGLKLLGV